MTEFTNFSSGVIDNILVVQIARKAYIFGEILQQTNALSRFRDNRVYMSREGKLESKIMPKCLCLFAFFKGMLLKRIIG